MYSTDYSPTTARRLYWEGTAAGSAAAGLGGGGRAPSPAADAVYGGSSSVLNIPRRQSSSSSNGFNLTGAASPIEPTLMMGRSYTNASTAGGVAGVGGGMRGGGSSDRIGSPLSRASSSSSPIRSPPRPTAIAVPTTTATTTSGSSGAAERPRPRQLSPTKIMPAPTATSRSIQTAQATRVDGDGAVHGRGASSEQLSSEVDELLRRVRTTMASASLLPPPAATAPVNARDGDHGHYPSTTSSGAAEQFFTRPPSIGRDGHTRGNAAQSAATATASSNNPAAHHSAAAYGYGDSPPPSSSSGWGGGPVMRTNTAAVLRPFARSPVEDKATSPLRRSANHSPSPPSPTGAAAGAARPSNTNAERHQQQQQAMAMAMMPFPAMTYVTSVNTSTATNHHHHYDGAPPTTIASTAASNILPSAAAAEKGVRGGNGGDALDEALGIIATEQHLLNAARERADRLEHELEATRRALAQSRLNASSNAIFHNDVDNRSLGSAGVGNERQRQQRSAADTNVASSSVLIPTSSSYAAGAVDGSSSPNAPLPSPSPIYRHGNAHSNKGGAAAAVSPRRDHDRTDPSVSIVTHHGALPLHTPASTLASAAAVSTAVLPVAGGGGANTHNNTIIVGENTTIDDIMSTSHATVSALKDANAASQGTIAALTAQVRALQYALEEANETAARKAAMHQADLDALADVRVESAKLAKEARASALLLQLYRREYQRLADQVRLLMSAGVGEIAQLTADQSSSTLAAAVGPSNTLAQRRNGSPTGNGSSFSSGAAAAAFPRGGAGGFASPSTAAMGARGGGGGHKGLGGEVSFTRLVATSPQARLHASARRGERSMSMSLAGGGGGGIGNMSGNKGTATSLTPSRALVLGGGGGGATPSAMNTNNSATPAADAYNASRGLAAANSGMGGQQHFFALPAGTPRLLRDPATGEELSLAVLVEKLRDVDLSDDDDGDDADSGMYGPSNGGHDTSLSLVGPANRTAEEDVLVRVTKDLLRRTRHSTCQSVIDHYQQHVRATEDSAAIVGRSILVSTEGTFRGLYTKLSDFERRINTLTVKGLMAVRANASKAETIRALQQQLGDKVAQEAFVRQCQDATAALRQLLKEGAEEIRQRILDTKLLQPQFIASIEKTVARAVRHTETLLSSASMMVSPSAMGSPSYGGGLGGGNAVALAGGFASATTTPTMMAAGASGSNTKNAAAMRLHAESLLNPSSPLTAGGVGGVGGGLNGTVNVLGMSTTSLLSAGSPFMGQQLTQKTAESLVQQLRNLCTLLQNNYEQQETIVDRYSSIVKDWEDRILERMVSEVQSQARAVHSGSSPVASGGGGGRRVGSHAASADAQMTAAMARAASPPQRREGNDAAGRATSPLGGSGGRSGAHRPSPLTTAMLQRDGSVGAAHQQPLTSATYVPTGDRTAGASAAFLSSYSPLPSTIATERVGVHPYVPTTAVVGTTANADANLYGSPPPRTTNASSAYPSHANAYSIGGGGGVAAVGGLSTRPDTRAPSPAMLGR